MRFINYMREWWYKYQYWKWYAKTTEDMLRRDRQA